MIYAAVDVGTNSCRLLIARKGIKDDLVSIYKEIESTRIGEGLNQTGYLKQENIEKTISCLHRFKTIMDKYGVKRYKAIATSAVREAANGEEFTEQALRRSNVQVDIINGEEEARLSYLGVEKGIKLDLSPLVADLGGGSTEFSCPDEGISISLPLGAVRATEVNMSVQEIHSLLEPIIVNKKRLKERSLVMVGGTATTLAAMEKGLEVYNPEEVHGTVINLNQIKRLYKITSELSLEQRRRLPGLQPERADIICKGFLIVQTLAEALDKNEIIVSESDLLEGMIWSMYPCHPLTHFVESGLI